MKNLEPLTEAKEVMINGILLFIRHSDFWSISIHPYKSFHWLQIRKCVVQYVTVTLLDGKYGLMSFKNYEMIFWKGTDEIEIYTLDWDGDSTIPEGWLFRRYSDPGNLCIHSIKVVRP